MLTEIILLFVCGIACVLAFILGLLVARDDKGIEEHRAYLKGYKTGLKKGLEQARKEAEQNELLYTNNVCDDGR